MSYEHVVTIAHPLIRSDKCDFRLILLTCYCTRACAFTFFKAAPWMVDCAQTAYCTYTSCVACTMCDFLWIDSIHILYNERCFYWPWSTCRLSICTCWCQEKGLLACYDCYFHISNMLFCCVWRTCVLTAKTNIPPSVCLYKISFDTPVHYLILDKETPLIRYLSTPLCNSFVIALQVLHVAKASSNIFVNGSYNNTLKSCNKSHSTYDKFILDKVSLSMYTAFSVLCTSFSLPTPC